MSDREQAEQMQERISELCHARLAPLLEKLCDELDPGDTVLRIDKLSIDVGSMAEDELDELLEHRLEKQLRDEIQAQLYERSLHQAIQEVGGILFPEDGENKSFAAPKNISESAALEHFLTTGTLPWWKSDIDQKKTSILFKEIFERNTQMIVETVIRVTTNVHVSRRIVNTVPTEQLIELHNVLQQSYTAKIEKFEKDIRQLVRLKEVQQAVQETHKLHWPTLNEWIKDAHAFGIVAQYPVEDFPTALIKYWVKTVAAKVAEKPTELAVILQQAAENSAEQFESELPTILPKVVEELSQASLIDRTTRTNDAVVEKSKAEEKFEHNPLVEFIQPEKPVQKTDVIESPLDDRVFEEQAKAAETNAEVDPIKAQEYEEGDYEMSETLSSVKDLEASEGEESISDQYEPSTQETSQEDTAVANEAVESAVSVITENQTSASNEAKASDNLSDSNTTSEQNTTNEDASDVEKEKQATSARVRNERDTAASKTGPTDKAKEDEEAKRHEISKAEQASTDEEEQQPPISKAEQHFKNNPLVEFVRPVKPQIASEDEVEKGLEEDVPHSEGDADESSKENERQAAHSENDQAEENSPIDIKSKEVTKDSAASAPVEESAKQSAKDSELPKDRLEEEEDKSQQKRPKQKFNAPSKGMSASIQSPSSYIHPLRANWKGEESFYRWGDTPHVNEDYINNCGLVLLWVYLPNFFKNLGYLNGKEFVSEEAQFKAVNILQKVVFGVDAEYEEFDLSLNKILCGLDVGAAVPTDITFTKEELEHADNLCVAAVKNWAVLKNTPVDGFRQVFLQRKGKLEKDGNGWRIYVEPTTPDVLISFLPWSIQIIKLPWVSSMIFTEWKTQF